MERFRQFNRESPDTLSQVVRDELLDAQTAYALFCSDLLNCQKVIVNVTDDNDDVKVYVIALIRALPLVVYNHDVGQHDIYSGICVDPNALPVELTNMKSATNSNLFVISEWLRPSYNIFREISGDGICLDISGESGGTREIWNKYKHRLFEWYRNAEIPIYDVPMPPMVSFDKAMTKNDVINYVPPVLPDDSSTSQDGDESLSEQMWGKLIGYYTAYIDNLGVFVKTGLQMDNIYAMNVNDENFIICRMLLNSGEQENQDTFEYVSQLIPGIGIFGSIGNVYEDRKKSWKFFIPRVYAFDRQDFKVLDHYDYMLRAKSYGAKEFRPDNNAGYPLHTKLYLRYPEWSSFLYPIFKTRSAPLKYAPEGIKNRIEYEERNNGRGKANSKSTNYSRRVR